MGRFIFSESLGRPQLVLAERIRQLILNRIGDVLTQDAVVSSRIEQREKRGADIAWTEFNIDARLGLP